MKSEEKLDKVSMFGLVLLFCYFPFIYLEAYVKANSSAQAKICGEVVKVYQKSESRGKYDYFDIHSQDMRMSFSPTIHSMKTDFNANARKVKNLAKTLKVGDKICVIYSTKYNESSILEGGQKVPYVFNIEKSQ